MEKLKQKKEKITNLKNENKKNDKPKTTDKKAKARRNNVKLYPIYKMFSWDNICFYSVEFLFYTITKKVSVSEILIINAFYILFKILAQIPAVTIVDYFKYKKSMIIGNVITIIYILTLILAPGAVGIIIADFLCALGYAIKNVSETNLLYDSVSTRGGEGLYSKIDSKGTSWYYLLDAFMALLSGYLFVKNNYLPMFICLGFTIVSTILSFKFIDIHKQKKNPTLKVKKYLKEYSKDLRKSSRYIMRSGRLRSYILFGSVFYAMFSLINIYKNDLLLSKGVGPQEYAIIYGLITLLASMSAGFSRIFHKKYRNRSLTVMSMSYVIACIIIGVSSIAFNNLIALPIMIAMYGILRMNVATWHVLKQKYLKNFTTEKTRTKISFTFELVAGIVASVFLLIGSILVKIIQIENAFIIVSLVLLVLVVLTLDYMRPRFGLKPREYQKEDIDF